MMERYFGNKKVIFQTDATGVVYATADCSVYPQNALVRIRLNPAERDQLMLPRVDRACIQDVLPDMIPCLRELFVSGRTPAEWWKDMQVYPEPYFTTVDALRTLRSYGYEFDEDYARQIEGMGFKFEVHRYADVSTAYLTKEDAELMDKPGCPMRFAQTPALHGSQGFLGAFFYMPQEDERPEWEKEVRDFGFSESFINIFTEALRQGIPYVRFDCDGGGIEGAPTFEW